MKTTLTIVQVIYLLFLGLIILRIGDYYEEIINYNQWTVERVFEFLPPLILIFVICQNLHLARINKRNLLKFKNDLIFHRIFQINNLSLKLRRIIGLLSICFFFLQTHIFLLIALNPYDDDFLTLFEAGLFFTMQLNLLWLLVSFVKIIYNWINGSRNIEELG